MQLEPEDQKDDRRTILFKKSTLSPGHETSSNKSWDWNTLKQLKSAIGNAIGYIKRTKDGSLNLIAEKNVDRDDLIDAVLEHVGINKSTINPKIWNQLPASIANDLRAHFSNECKITTREWNRKDEEGLTGCLFRSTGINTKGGWEIKINPVEFSPKVKEPHTGADVALLIHVRNGTGETAIKTLWFQAKKPHQDLNDLSGISDLSKQFDLMRKITAESFPLIYGKKSITVAEDLTSGKRIDLADFIAETVQCNHGDARLELFADSLDRKFIFEVAIKKKPKSAIKVAAGIK